MTQATYSATARLLSRTSTTVPVDVTKGATPSDIARAVIATQDDPASVYAIQIAQAAAPGSFDGALDIKNYDPSGRSLDNRKVSITVKEDGRATLSFSHDKGKTWALVGVMTSEALAKVVGELWTEGVIHTDLKN
ncbi:hypothetical protein [Microvirga tunisiensis]|uniref:Uncharacterized protein n=1 Tax=Microvirga tunisiensis TaxID=2108360 RepID=A0A5N7MAD0_9HYPH|nr:hypothetical protein [Microvirga tunisiensis]MPR05673.1 hypothetical protein [Microvirga tunisiensis]MPR23873.1 hypothetical protein [Microvirga tunisiensis]